MMMGPIETNVYLGGRLVGLVGITERETGVGKLSWLGNFTVFDRKKYFFFA